METNKNQKELLLSNSRVAPHPRKSRWRNSLPNKGDGCLARACEPNKPWLRGSDGKHLFTSKTLRRWSRYGSGLQPYFQVRFHTQDVFLLGLTIASARTSLPVPDICQSPPMQVYLPQAHYSYLPILDPSKLGYRRGPSLIG